MCSGIIPKKGKVAGTISLRCGHGISRHARYDGRNGSGSGLLLGSCRKKQDDTRGLDAKGIYAKGIYALGIDAQCFIEDWEEAEDFLNPFRTPIPRQ